MMRKLPHVTVSCAQIAAFAAMALTVGCSGSSSPLAPSSKPNATITAASTTPVTTASHPGPCRDSACKDMQNLSFGIISFKPTFTYVDGATVEVKAPDAPYTVLATGTTHRRGDVDLHIPRSYTSVLVTVTASGYCTITDRLFQLPVGAGYWIDMTAGC